MASEVHREGPLNVGCGEDIQHFSTCSERSHSLIQHANLEFLVEATKRTEPQPGPQKLTSKYSGWRLPSINGSFMEGSSLLMFSWQEKSGGVKLALSLNLKIEEKPCG